MNTTTKIARVILQVAGAAALLLGVIIWTAGADGLIPTHKTLGDLAVLALWTIAAVAARAGVSLGAVALAAGVGLAVPVFGAAQTDLLTGSWHWTVQVLHVVISMIALALGLRLVFAIRGRDAGQGSSLRTGDAAEHAYTPGSPAR